MLDNIIFTNMELWESAIDKADSKGISKALLTELCAPENRVMLYRMIMNDGYDIAPPHAAQIPKDNGEFRTVYANEPFDRVFLAIVNDILFQECGFMVHPNAKAYQKGIGCGKIVREISSRIADAKGAEIGWKADLSKYFDSVPIKYIDEAFELAERKIGKSKSLDVVKRYYHSDLYFDLDNNLCENYTSLKQGCAVASWLANVVLYDLDEKLSKLDGVYYRYSDDLIFVGKDYKKAMDMLKAHIEGMSMTLNPKKIEYISSERWVKFLGFSIKGDKISLSKNRIKTFQKEIASRTIKANCSYTKALNKVNAYLYRNMHDYSWASQVLNVINSEEDIQALNEYVMDCLRAVITGKKKLYGLGYDISGKKGVIPHATGKNVAANRSKVPWLDGYTSLMTYKKAPRVAKEAMVLQM